jgi:hypothetical protein
MMMVTRRRILAAHTSLLHKPCQSFNEGRKEEDLTIKRKMGRTSFVVLAV